MQNLCHLTELRFYVPLDTNYVIFDTFLKPSSWLGVEKQNLTQQKDKFTNQKKCTTTQNKHKKLKPCLVPSYDILPGNGDGLFLFWHSINLSHKFTYLNTYPLLTAPGPTWGTYSTDCLMTGITISIQHQHLTNKHSQ